MDEFHETREINENITPLEELKSQIQTQTVTIRTLKVLLDQYKNEIDRIHSSKSSSCVENTPPCNDKFESVREGVEIKLALQVCFFFKL